MIAAKRQDKRGKESPSGGLGLRVGGEWEKIGAMRSLWVRWLAAGCRVALGFAAGGAYALAATFSGTDWIMHYNVPDQKTGNNNAMPDEYVIRDAWLARINALQKGDWAALSTYTMSGSSSVAGAAGPMLEAVSKALDRGAKVGWVVGNGVAVSSNFWSGGSLTSLATRKTNPLKFKQAPKGGIMHDKMGVFAYKGQTPWVLTGSWNFTGGACSQQWNVMVEIQNAALAAACSNELRQLLSGKFHADETKSHAWDGTKFRLAGWTRDGWIRFAPYPDGKYGGNNALTDITNAIAGAKEEIFFGLNKLTRSGVVDALIDACNRGVVVHGTVPLSDWLIPSQDSWECMQQLLSPTNYATANRARIYLAYTTGDKDEPDNVRSDLVHTKYMVIDPWNATNALVIQGSANWTAAALVLTSANDENVEFLPSAEIAQTFVEQYRAMTDGLLPVVTSMTRTGAGKWTLGYWHEPGVFALQRTAELSGGWRDVLTLPATRRGTTTDAPPSSSAFYRLIAK